MYISVEKLSPSWYNCCEEVIFSPLFLSFIFSLKESFYPNCVNNAKKSGECETIKLFSVNRVAQRLKKCFSNKLLWMKSEKRMPQWHFCWILWFYDSEKNKLFTCVSCSTCALNNNCTKTTTKKNTMRKKTKKNVLKELPRKTVTESEWREWEKRQQYKNFKYNWFGRIQNFWWYSHFRHRF